MAENRKELEGLRGELKSAKRWKRNIEIITHLPLLISFIPLLGTFFSDRGFDEASLTEEIAIEALWDENLMPPEEWKKDEIDNRIFYYSDWQEIDGNDRILNLDNSYYYRIVAEMNNVPKFKDNGFKEIYVDFVYQNDLDEEQILENNRVSRDKIAEKVANINLEYEFFKTIDIVSIMGLGFLAYKISRELRQIMNQVMDYEIEGVKQKIRKHEQDLD